MRAGGAHPQLRAGRPHAARRRRSVLDLAKESEATKKLYGLDNPETAGYGLRCLMARRLVEAGVRFVQVFPPVSPSSSRGTPTTTSRRDITNDLPANRPALRGADQGPEEPRPARRAIVLWTGEFGRLPVSQNGNGRDHNRNAFSLLLAGGGFKAGHVHGATDEVGYKAVEERVSVPDLHATLLHQLGMDHGI